MDGTAGAVRIRQAGGVVLVQDPKSALHDNMPNAVISHGIANYVLPVGAIARQLVACAAASYVRPESTVDANAEVSRTLDRLLELVRQRAGFDFRGYKPSPLLWRIQQRMDVRLAARFEDYLALLEDDTAELEALVRSLPIHGTEFFRDPLAWKALNRDVLEPLFGENGEAQPIRTWTPACSTGEEAYPPFTALDLLTCRNLLIYLEPDAAKRVVLMLHSALRMGGHLFLGRGESLPTRQTGFECVSREWNIYRKVGPIADIGIRFSVAARRTQQSAVSEIAHRAAVEHFGLPSVLVDERLQVLRIYGDTKHLCGCRAVCPRRIWSTWCPPGWSPSCGKPRKSPSLAAAR